MKVDEFTFHTIRRDGEAPFGVVAAHLPDDGYPQVFRWVPNLGYWARDAHHEEYFDLSRQSLLAEHVRLREAHQSTAVIAEALDYVFDPISPEHAAIRAAQEPLWPRGDLRSYHCDLDALSRAREHRSSAEVGLDQWLDDVPAEYRSQAAAFLARADKIWVTRRVVGDHAEAVRDADALRHEWERTHPVRKKTRVVERGDGWHVQLQERQPRAGLVDTAVRLAWLAHCEQVDKAGEAYITHPTRVAKRVRQYGDEVAFVAAWLHDTVEDTWVTPGFLARAGFPPAVLRCVDAVTKRDGESEEGYANRIAANRAAILVKQADLADNTDPQRMARLDPQDRRRLGEKYAQFAARLDHAVSLRDQWAFAMGTLERIAASG